MTITADEYEIWRESPITQWVLSGVARFAEGQRETWATASWASGVADQAALDRMKTRADAYQGLAELTFEQAQGLHEEDAKA